MTKAYESLLILTLRQPDSEEYLDFAEEVKRRAKTMYNYDFGSDETVVNPLYNLHISRFLSYFLVSHVLHRTYLHLLSIGYQETGFSMKLLHEYKFSIFKDYLIFGC